MECPACGSQDQDLRRYCSRCGRPLPRRQDPGSRPAGRWRAYALGALAGAGVAAAGLGVALGAAALLREAATDELEPLLDEVGLGDSAALGLFALSRVRLAVETDAAGLLADLRLSGEAAVPVLGWLAAAVLLLAWAAGRLSAGGQGRHVAATALAVAAGYWGALVGAASVYRATVAEFVVAPEVSSAAVWGAVVGVTGAGLGAARRWAAAGEGTNAALTRTALRSAARAGLIATLLALPIALAATAVAGRRLDVTDFAGSVTGEVIVAVLFALAAVPDALAMLLVAACGATVRVGATAVGVGALGPFGWALLAIPVAAVLAGMRSARPDAGDSPAAAWAGVGAFMAAIVLLALAVSFTLTGEVTVGSLVNEGEFRVRVPVLRMLLLAGLWTAAAGLAGRRAEPGEGSTCPHCGRPTLADGRFCVRCGAALVG